MNDSTMILLEERAVLYVRKYIDDHFNGDKTDDHFVDRWVDEQITQHRMSSFEINTASDLIEAMNYVNKHNDYYNIFSPTETVESIKHQFLYEIIGQHQLMSC